jgi:multimeric flavodoxin WrbA
MKILICRGSYQRRGNTARITVMIEEQLHKLANLHGELLEIERIYLARLDIRQCRGCQVDCLEAVP